MGTLVPGLIAVGMLLQLPSTPPQFKVQLLDGRTLSGAIAAWDEGQITLTTGDGEQRLELDRLAELVNTGLASATDAVPEPADGSCELGVGLRGGSRLCVSSIKGTARSWTLQRGQDKPWTLPGPQLRYVRFRKPTAELRKQWSEMLEADYTADVLIIRRSASSLDFLEGVIHGINEREVLFEFEAEQMQVQREKLEGCVFFSGPQPRSDAAEVTLDSTWGDHIVAQRVVWGARQWQVQIAKGVLLPLAVEQVQRVRFASSRVTYPSDMRPISGSFDPMIGSREGNAEYLKIIYAPRMDQGYDGPLQLQFPGANDYRTFAKGIAAHSRTQLVYRLDGEKARLLGLAGMAPESGVTGSARLAITVDGRVMFDQIIQRPGAPVSLDIDLSGGRRLEILVDYGDDGDLGDRLYLCDLRIIK